MSDRIRQWARFGETEAYVIGREEEDKLRWDAAFLTDDILTGYPVYGVTIATEAGALYGCVRYRGLTMSGGLQIDVPIQDDTPEEVLVNDFYMNATFFGEIDGERFEELARNKYQIDRLMAHLNKKTFAVGKDQDTNWFYQAIKCGHLEERGDILIGSHGGMNKYGYDYSATIEHNYGSRPKGVELPGYFEEKVNKSLPHLTLAPMPREDYLMAVAANLPFRPQDWNVS